MGKPFIGRKAEIEKIENMLDSHGNLYIFLVDGKGGIGKTRLLEEVYKRFSDKIHTLELIDLSSLRLQTVDGLIGKIRLHFKEWNFEDYEWEMGYLKQMEIEGASQSAIHEQRSRIYSTFVKSFNLNTASQCVMILLDTADEGVRKRDFWPILKSSVLAHMQNALILIAGRYISSEASDWPQVKSSQVQTLRIEGLGVDEIWNYMKQIKASNAITREVCETLHILSEGRPIMVDLSIDWLTRQLQLPDIVKKHYQEIEGLSNKEKHNIREEFLREMVHPIMQLTKPLPDIILDLAHIFNVKYDPEWIDYNFIADLEDISVEECRKCLTDLTRFSFVKERDHKVWLHDEMREMITEYLWERSEDPDKEIRCEISQSVVEDLNLKIKSLSKYLDYLAKSYEPERKRSQPDREKLFNLIQEREQEEAMRQARLEHTLYYDFEGEEKSQDGVELFKKEVDKAKQSYRFDFRNILIGIIEPHLKKHDQNGQYLIHINKAEHLFDEGRYEETRDILIPMSEKYQNDIEKYVELVILLGNCYIRLGNYEQAEHYFIQAEKECNSHVSGKVQNALGWLKRLQGNWQEAEIWYRKSLNTSAADRDHVLTAQIFNNLGYLCSLNGKFDTASSFCRKGLDIRKKNQLTRDAGISHITIANICRHKGDYFSHNKDDYNNSEYHFELALEIFQKWKTDEWLSTLYIDFTKTQIRMHRTNGTKETLENFLSRLKAHSKIMRHNWLQPSFKLRLGLIEWELGNPDIARDYFEQGLKLSRELKQEENELEILITLAELNYTQPAKVSDLLDLIDEHLKQNQSLSTIFLGKAIKLKGDLAFDRKDYNEALKNYSDAFPYLRHYRDGRLTLREELQDLEKRLRGLSPETAAKLWSELEIQWSKIPGAQMLVDFCILARA